MFLLLDQQRQNEDRIYDSVFRNREGFRETRDELEQAGIDPNEIEALQRIELHNARRLLRNFGSRAIENINLLRMILNVDGDRNPEELEATRVMLFTRLESITYDKTVNGDMEPCAIWYSDYVDGDLLKVLPKCKHSFHQECIEKWVLKARNRSVLCPLCKIDIKEELDTQDQISQVSSHDESNSNGVNNIQNQDIDNPDVGSDAMMEAESRDDIEMAISNSSDQNEGEGQPELLD